MDARTRREIEWDCRALSHAFAYHIDHRHYEDLANLFAPDGIWIRHGETLRGRAAIIAAMNKRPANQFTRHVTTGFHFTHVDETSAKSVANNMSYYSFEAAEIPAPFVPEQMLLLDFIDTYTKTAEGWRFAERNTDLVFAPAAIIEAMKRPHG